MILYCKILHCAFKNGFLGIWLYKNWHSLLLYRGFCILSEKIHSHTFWQCNAWNTRRWLHFFILPWRYKWNTLLVKSISTGGYCGDHYVSVLCKTSRWLMHDYNCTILLQNFIASIRFLQSVIRQSSTKMVKKFCAAHIVVYVVEKTTFVTIKMELYFVGVGLHQKRCNALQVEKK